MKTFSVLKLVLVTMFIPLVTVRAQINGSVFQVTPSPDGKIYITGNFTAVGGEIHNGIARLNANGSVDSSFTGSLPGGGGNLIFLANGNILAVGSFAGNKTFTSTGSLDTSYPSWGGQYTLLGNSDGSFYTGSGLYSGAGSLLTSLAVPFSSQAMAKQSDGKLVIGGANGTMIRLNSNGSVDSSFTPPTGIFGGNIHGVGVQGDGKIVVSGAYFALLPNVFRLNPNGTVDSSFTAASSAFGPIFSLTDGSSLISGANNSKSITFDSSGRIFIAGSLTRLAEDGSLFATQPMLDPAFNQTLGFSVYLPVSAIPEPSTYAAIFGVTVLGVAVYRRRKTSV